MLMGMSMKVNGLMIKLTEKANTCILMVRHMRENGKMTSSMDTEKKNGLTDQCMRGSMLKVKRLVKVNLHGLMEVLMKVILMMLLRDLEHTHGRIKGSMLEIGKIIKCTAKECLLGLTGEDLKGFTSTIRSTVMVTSHGLMVVLMKVPG